MNRSKLLGLIIIFLLALTACQSVPVGSGAEGTTVGPTQIPASEPTAGPTNTPIPEPTVEPTSTSTPTPELTETPTPTPEPVEKTSILGFLQTAILPVGQTMYVWGGGWNEEDTGAGVEAVTLGISPAWAEFAAKQDAAYDYKKTKYQIHDGLDCSGYVGWVVYNVLETENGKDGYVLSSTKMAEEFASHG